MMSEAELFALADKYQAKADKDMENYQETGITRYNTSRMRNEDLADALRMAARAADDYNSLAHLRVTVSTLAGRANNALRLQKDKKPEAMEKIIRDLLSTARMMGLISNDAEGKE